MRSGARRKRVVGNRPSLHLSSRWKAGSTPLNCFPGYQVDRGSFDVWIDTMSHAVPPAEWVPPCGGMRKI